MSYKKGVQVGYRMGYMKAQQDLRRKIMYMYNMFQCRQSYTLLNRKVEFFNFSIQFIFILYSNSAFVTTANFYT